MSLSERFFDSAITESWMIQAHRAYVRYLGEKPEIDPIVAERMKEWFIEGFMAASRPPPADVTPPTQVVPLDPSGVIELSRRLTPYIQGFGKHGMVAPGDMMVALAIILTTIGRQMHSSMSHGQVFEAFASEMPMVLRALDKAQSTPLGETQH